MTPLTSVFGFSSSAKTLETKADKSNALKMNILLFFTLPPFSLSNVRHSMLGPIENIVADARGFYLLLSSLVALHDLIAKDTDFDEG